MKGTNNTNLGTWLIPAGNRRTKRHWKKSSGRSFKTNKRKYFYTLYVIGLQSSLPQDLVEVHCVSKLKKWSSKKWKNNPKLKLLAWEFTKHKLLEGADISGSNLYLPSTLTLPLDLWLWPLPKQQTALEGSLSHNCACSYTPIYIIFTTVLNEKLSVLLGPFHRWGINYVHEGPKQHSSLEILTSNHNLTVKYYS